MSQPTRDKQLAVNRISPPSFSQSVAAAALPLHGGPSRGPGGATTQLYAICLAGETANGTKGIRREDEWGTWGVDAGGVAQPSPERGRSAALFLAARCSRVPPALSHFGERGEKVAAFSLPLSLRGKASERLSAAVFEAAQENRFASSRFGR